MNTKTKITVRIEVATNGIVHNAGDMIDMRAVYMQKGYELALTDLLDGEPDGYLVDDGESATITVCKDQ